MLTAVQQDKVKGHIPASLMGCGEQGRSRRLCCSKAIISGKLKSGSRASSVPIVSKRSLRRESPSGALRNSALMSLNRVVISMRHCGRFTEFYKRICVGSLAWTGRLRQNYAKGALRLFGVGNARNRMSRYHNGFDKHSDRTGGLEKNIQPTPAVFSRSRILARSPKKSYDERSTSGRT